MSIVDKSPHVPVITLNSGAKMPLEGLGTWKMRPSEAGPAIRNAVAHGFRHFDCAAIYRNENCIGEALQECIGPNGLYKRSDIFVTSKLWNTCHHPDNVREACVKSLRDLQLDYLDLYLMHFPIAFQFTDYDLTVGIPKDVAGRILFCKVSIQETWKAMEKLVDEGLVKSIGVSNFNIVEIQDLLTYARIRPAVCQVELHPYLTQQPLIEYGEDQGIHMTAYTPLGQFPDGTGPMLEPIVKEIANKYYKTPGQILLKWGIQRGTSVIPKTVHAHRMEENMNIWDFMLTQKEMEKISELNKNKRVLYTKREWGWEMFPV